MSGVDFATEASPYVQLGPGCKEKAPPERAALLIRTVSTALLGRLVLPRIDVTL
jgi:hypothetical protein